MELANVAEHVLQAFISKMELFDMFQSQMEPNDEIFSTKLAKVSLSRHTFWVKAEKY